MSRQELADACNAELASMYAKRGRRQRWAGLSEKTIGALERGEIRWPNDDYRWALCTVLQANERSLGLYIDRSGNAENGEHPGNAEPYPGQQHQETVPAHWRPGTHEPESPQASQTLDAFGTPSEWRAWLWRGVLGRDHRHIVLPTHELEAALRYGNLAYQSAQYSELRQLPILIGGAESLFAEQPKTVDVPRMARAVSGVYLLASKLAAKLGDGELAWTTADRARCFGLIAADPALTAIAAYQTACALAKQPGRAAAAEEVAVDAADAIASHKLHRTPAYLSAYGALLLHAAVAAARQADDRGAWGHLQAAESAADQLGRNSNELWTAFGPANVRLHRISVAVALQDNRQALRTADQLDSSQLPMTLTSRRAQVHLDLAAAHSATGSSDPQAMLQLLEYERLVPEAIKLNATAAKLIAKLLRRERPSHTPGLRALADRAGVRDS
ncbi:hypothetical protein [Micromonospora echinaurantiaca]|uniref:hypothetical protein n=1 Tax=Micromonospora echinaurantiaca TaxID=47857 RepID=UPI003788372C